MSEPAEQDKVNPDEVKRYTVRELYEEHGFRNSQVALIESHERIVGELRTIAEKEIYKLQARIGELLDEKKHLLDAIDNAYAKAKEIRL